MSTNRAVFFTSGAGAALEEAIRANDPSAIARALAGGAVVNAVSKQGVSPLMIAVDAQKLSAVRALLQAGANPNLKAADGRSAVSLAVENCAAQPDGRAIMLAA